MSTDTGRERRTGGVQSLERAFAVLEAMADAGGAVTLSQLATETDLPLPTIHRLVRTLVDLGYVRQEASRQYILGPRLIRLGETSSRMLGRWARPQMERLAHDLGESVNLALLDGDQVVYVGQVMASRNSMRMFTEVGRRALPHSTGVGKALMAQMPEADVHALLARTGMPAATPHTLTDEPTLLAELATIRERGYALDEGEQEVGVRCVAVAVPSSMQPLALSVSGPLPRMGDDVVEAAVGPLTDAAARIADEISRWG
ncbi:IclR family transcriptional regulator [Luteipulveratus halotolerans]|uniref:Glycerol operon regulatory protein n=1 Tax=Luteipulveratus halotolerans TaxID=1631356 RepID=A0A0L6CEV1_9MICO|nr:IclR family transcriptional regulator [Luteipulveratus halotolerans]KNX36023.1 IclR family transcriptional regulator [Luteipulveratus halotolerans]